ncbi:MAG: transglycosylase SLT domain-containing protein [Bacteroidaceae bacterium]|nr:transglycosylase SLT domain-containing protein [Bacteroidaceae bacterium]
MKKIPVLLLSLVVALNASAVNDRKKTTARVDTVFVVDTVYFSAEDFRKLRNDSSHSDAWKTIVDDSLMLLESETVNIDSLLNEWHARSYLYADEECLRSEANPQVSDSVYKQRLSNLPTIVPMVYNQPVRAVIDRYATRNRALVSYMLGMMKLYMPEIEQALDYYNVPNELKYLPVIESALNPKAVSRAKAAGMWQFMYATGKLYGLKQNSLVDDRFDPLKETWAAAHHLRDLYDMFGDWTLAIAAYNCGPGNINKAIRRSGGKTDFWDIYWYLPKETRGYVPAFIAANYIMTYYAEHGICPMDCALPIATDTIMLHRNVHLQQVADVCDVNMQTLRGLNPQYKEDIIPASFEPYALQLPMDKIPVFLDNEASVYSYKSEEFFPPQKSLELQVKPTAQRNGGGSSGRYTVHKIRKGESLGSIARKYRVSVSQLKKWNGLRSDRIQAGRTLKIYK